MCHPPIYINSRLYLSVQFPTSYTTIIDWASDNTLVSFANGSAVFSFLTAEKLEGILRDYFEQRHENLAYKKSFVIQEYALFQSFQDPSEQIFRLVEKKNTLPKELSSGFRLILLFVNLSN